MKSYNIVVNSNFCTTATAGNANSDKDYYIDWTSIMPQGEYELTFSFLSKAADAITTLGNLPLIYVDFLSQGNIDAPKPGFQATASQFLGMVFPIVIHQPTDSSVLRAEQSSNNPIFLVNRPYNNKFRVQVVNGANPPVAWVDDSAIPVGLPSYIMNLHFRLLKEL
ncbi:MAG: hypothetical protein RLZZ354_586 [Pseudomonadota bacterium]|jgi:hypothetical protein